MSGFLGGGIGPVALKRRRAATGNGLLNNLIAYWPLNEAGGANNALDLHSNALHLTQNSSPGAGTGKVYVTARTFDGSADYFSRASEALLQTGDVDFTIAAWVYPTSAPPTDQFSMIVSKAKNTLTAFEYSMQMRNISGSNSWGFSVYNATVTTIRTVGIVDPSLNVWSLLIAAYNSVADTITLSLNGATPASTALDGVSVAASDAVFEIGRYAWASNFYFPGRLGPVAMWKSAAGGGGVLTAAQRTALWNGGAGLAYADFTV